MTFCIPHLLSEERVGEESRGKGKKVYERGIQETKISTSFGRSDILVLRLALHDEHVLSRAGDRVEVIRVSDCDLLNMGN